MRQLAVVHGRVTLSSGKEADYYVDLRRATLHHRAAPLIGRLIRELTDDWDYAAVGGLTLGADPVATAVMHAPGRPIDAFVVRKSVKTHGMQRLIEGPEIAGRAGSGGRGHQHHRRVGADRGARGAGRRRRRWSAWRPWSTALPGRPKPSKPRAFRTAACWGWRTSG